MLEQRQHRAQRPSFDKNRGAQPRFCASVAGWCCCCCYAPHPFFTLNTYNWMFVYVYSRLCICVLQIYRAILWIKWNSWREQFLLEYSLEIILNDVHLNISIRNHFHSDTFCHYSLLFTALRGQKYLNVWKFQSKNRQKQNEYDGMQIFNWNSTCVGL